MRLIDADELWKAITTRIEEYCDIADLIEIIETQPTVNVCSYWDNESDYCALNKPSDAEPVRHGHWIDVNGDGSLWRCSVCGETQCCNSNYCGDCGAKMDESTIGQVKPSDKEFTLYADEKSIVTFKDSKIVLHGERKEDGHTER